jgi:DNA-binding MarR family transcriptional regulator
MNETFSILTRSMKMRKDLSDSEKFLISHVSSFPNGCFQLKRTIAEELGWTESKVQRILSFLKKRELVDWTFDGRKNTIRLSNTKQAEDTKVDRLNQKCIPSSTISVSPEDTKVYPIDNRLKNIDNTTTTTPSLFEEPKFEYPMEFKEIWKAYPRRDNKGGALKAFQNIKPRPTEEIRKKMISKIDQWSNSEQWKKDGGKFIPMLSTWLNNRRWDDGKPPEPEDEMDRILRESKI